MPAYYRARGSVHPAIDLNAVTGAIPIWATRHAADSGRVVAIMWDSYIGGIVEIRHSDGSTSGYWHLQRHPRQGGRRGQGR